MAGARQRAAPQPPHPDHDAAWDPAATPAFTALLDHLAAELAHEYVRLMEQAAHPEASTPTPIPPIRKEV
jgi:hypothetical protein